MSALRVHACVSGSHRDLADRHLRPTFEATTNGDASLQIHQAPQHCPTGSFGADGWAEITREKLKMASAAARETADGEPFCVCDADIAFLRPWVSAALESLGDRDIVALAEPEFSPAFWLARGGPELQAMLDRLLQDWGRWPGDGAALAAGISAHDLSLGLLDRRFANPGNLGQALPLVFERATFTPPPDSVLFHANFCLLEDKSRLLDEVRRLAGGEIRVRNDDLVAEGPEGLGFFPPRKPDRPFDRQSMFTRNKALDVLQFVADRDVALIVEIGSWLGASTRWFLETFAGAPRPGLQHDHAELICIDTWGGLEEWHQTELRARTGSAWEQFCANCWHLRQFITPVRLPSRDGLPAVICELDRQARQPDLVFVTGDHGYEACLQDITTTAEAWPEALILGDDYGLEQPTRARPRPVRDAVIDAATEFGRRDLRVGDSGIWMLAH